MYRKRPCYSTFLYICGLRLNKMAPLNKMAVFTPKCCIVTVAILCHFKNWFFLYNGILVLTTTFSEYLSPSRLSLNVSHPDMIMSRHLSPWKSLKVWTVSYLTWKSKISRMSSTIMMTSWWCQICANFSENCLMSNHGPNRNCNGSVICKSSTFSYFCICIGFPMLYNLYLPPKNCHNFLSMGGNHSQTSRYLQT